MNQVIMLVWIVYVNSHVKWLLQESLLPCYKTLIIFFIYQEKKGFSFISFSCLSLDAVFYVLVKNICLEQNNFKISLNTYISFRV